MKYCNLSEEELVNLARNHDTKAFEILLNDSEEYLKKWILSMCRKNELLAEEIFQITSIKAWKNIDKFKGESKFKTWVCSISRNLFIDIKRKNDKRSEVCIEIDIDGDGVGEYRREASIEFDPLQKPKSKELNEFLSNVLDKLSYEQRSVLRYFAVEQLSYEEIAKAMQCSVGTVMSRLFYARKKAQKIFYRAEKRKDYCDAY